MRAMNEAAISPTAKKEGANLPAMDASPCDKFIGEAKFKFLALNPMDAMTIATIITSDTTAPRNVSNLNAHKLFTVIPFSAVADA